MFLIRYEMIKELIFSLFFIMMFGTSAHARSLLFDAAWLRQADKNDIQTQISIGAKLNATDDIGRTPLIYAIVFEKDAEIVELLIKNGAKVNTETDDGNSPLIYALSTGAAPEIIEILLRNGASVNVQDQYGRSPLVLAIKNNFHLMFCIIYVHFKSTITILICI